MVFLQLSYEGAGPQPIRHHIKWVFLGHSLLIVEVVTRPISRSDHQYIPVALAVECKPYTTGLLMPHRPQNGFPVIVIEQIVQVNEDEPPVLLMGVMLLITSTSQWR